MRHRKTRARELRERTSHMIQIYLRWQSRVAGPISAAGLVGCGQTQKQETENKRVRKQAQTFLGRRLLQFKSCVALLMHTHRLMGAPYLRYSCSRIRSNLRY